MVWCMAFSTDSMSCACSAFAPFCWIGLMLLMVVSYTLSRSMTGDLSWRKAWLWSLFLSYLDRSLRLTYS